ncbi:MAG: putative metal-binding motif-containing protein [Deltaproteobacteria bacterium]|nr:putative metal-binding motif-containing protein [Deltaproteobacteria bacterium]
MNNKIMSFIFGLLMMLITSSLAHAELCVVTSEKDTGISSTLRGKVEMVMADDEEGGCFINRTSDTYADAFVADNYIAFQTKESCPASSGVVKTIKLTNGQITFKNKMSLLVGNASDYSLNWANYTAYSYFADLGPDYLSSSNPDVGNYILQSEIDAADYPDCDIDVSEPSKYYDFGRVVVDSSEVEGAPFKCGEGAEKVYLRGIVFVGSAAYEDIFSQSCFKNGGDIHVCQGSIKEGTDLSKVDLYNQPKSDWCDEECTETITMYKDADGDGYTSAAGDNSTGGLGGINIGSKKDFTPWGRTTEGSSISDHISGDVGVVTDGTIQVGLGSSGSSRFARKTPSKAGIVSGTITKLDDSVLDSIIANAGKSATQPMGGTVLPGTGDGEVLLPNTVEICADDAQTYRDLGYKTEDELTGYNDCDDDNAAVNPGAEEICGDNVDNNCDGVDDECPATDDDGDGYTEDDGDCDDTNPEVNPGAEEICDGIDNDCDGEIDEGCDDNDGDGYPSDEDCDDNDPDVNPGADEICDDGVDNDCDGLVDEGCGGSGNGSDDDGDGYNEQQGDCDDTDASINPGAEEVCDDNTDNDCDGDIDEGCDDSGNDTDDDGDGYTENEGDCDDSDANINPDMFDICGDGIDQDCSGNDRQCAVEVCNDQIDNDEDGLADCEDPSCDTWYECNGVGPEEICDDGLDNDSDGSADCDDADCMFDTSCVASGSESACGDGIDNDGDGFADCEDADCQGFILGQDENGDDVTCVSTQVISITTGGKLTGGGGCGCDLTASGMAKPGDTATMLAGFLGLLLALALRQRAQFIENK